MPKGTILSNGFWGFGSITILATFFRKTDRLTTFYLYWSVLKDRGSVHGLQRGWHRPPTSILEVLTPQDQQCQRRKIQETTWSRLLPKLESSFLPPIWLQRVIFFKLLIAEVHFSQLTKKLKLKLPNLNVSPGRHFFTLYIFLLLNK